LAATDPRNLLALSYGDAPFLEVMWLKTVSAWITNRLGYNVLFQDVDVMWLKPFMHVFNDMEYDAFFMDDAARSDRFAPYFANSGFFYLRNNVRGCTHICDVLKIALAFPRV